MFRHWLMAAAFCGLVAAPCSSFAANESKIQTDLNTFAHQYVKSANKRMTVNRARPQVVKRGSTYVATFTEIDQETVTAQMRKSNSKHFEYVATLSYNELTFESVGKTRKEATSGQFRCVKVRKLTELPRYVKGKWEN
ncbi:hypothetical protein [uncultured Mailhella sp.]|uniref:hypothetical protein n=1 Tax=uncultured Mailhella sp. TaxID=1981031 RepID=UPI0025FBCE35|nr:hypothetical protein [uncultured Mailhella sp.]